MTSHSSRRIALFVAAISSACALTLVPAQAPAQDIDQLIAQMDEVSREATDKSEEVKQLELDIEANAADLEQRQEQVRVATEVADQAKANEDSLRGQVSRIAGAKYRGAQVDPITAAVSARSPQYAIDRTAYLVTLTKNTENAVQDLKEATKVAAQARSEAAQAVASAQYKSSQLEEQRNKLIAERDELNAKIEEITAQVEALSVTDRQRWVEKNGPVQDYSIEGLTSANPLGLDAVAAAMTKLGSPYGWGATGPDQFDCSGLVVWAYQQQGKTLPRTSQAQMAGGVPVSRADLQPGDVVGFYPGATHVGIYVGNGNIVHASDYGIPVQVVPMDSMPFFGARRY